MALEKGPLKDPAGVERARRRLAPRSTQRGIARLEKAICDPVRLRIVEALSVGPLCVDDLSIVIERTATATSQHLRVLRNIGLVEGDRRGTTVNYRLRPGPTTDHLQAVLRAMEIPEETG